MSSKIEEMIRKSLEDKLALCIHKIKEEGQFQKDALNEHFNSIIDTLNELQLNDASLLEYFEKTGGRIVVTSITADSQYVVVNVGDHVLRPNFSLDTGRRYKMILMFLSDE